MWTSTRLKLYRDKSITSTNGCSPDSYTCFVNAICKIRKIVAINEFYFTIKGELLKKKNSDILWKFNQVVIIDHLQSNKKGAASQVF